MFKYHLSWMCFVFLNFWSHRRLKPNKYIRVCVTVCCCCWWFYFALVVTTLFCVIMCVFSECWMSERTNGVYDKWKTQLNKFRRFLSAFILKIRLYRCISECVSSIWKTNWKIPKCIYILRTQHTAHSTHNIK